MNNDYVPTERAITDSIMKYLKQRGGVVLKMHGNVFTTQGIPDLFYAERGVGQFWFEVKRPDGRHGLSKMQDYVIRKMRENGVNVFVVTSKKDVINILGERDT